MIAFGNYHGCIGWMVHVQQRIRAAAGRVPGGLVTAAGRGQALPAPG
jgi:hypothetical protein